jgi:hypothetical protein
MNRREMIRYSGAAFLTASMGSRLWSFGSGEARKISRKKILFFSKSANYEHSVIRRDAGKPSFAERILSQIAPAHGFEFTFTKDGSLITPAYLSQFDALFFYTCGIITSDQPNVDKQPPMSAAGKQAVLDAIHRGKGFVGCHSASDTFHAGETPTAGVNPARYKNYGRDADPYTLMLGGEFIKHGKQQMARMRVVDERFPGCQGLSQGFELQEEWYSLKEFPKDLHVLLVQETTGMDGNEYKRAPYPATWAHKYGKGRVFYTSMGHREDVWANPIFQRILAGGLSWASRQVDADIKANIEIVAPGYSEIPPQNSPVSLNMPSASDYVARDAIDINTVPLMGNVNSCCD